MQRQFFWQIKVTLIIFKYTIIVYKIVCIAVSTPMLLLWLDVALYWMISTPKKKQIVGDE